MENRASELIAALRVSGDPVQVDLASRLVNAFALPKILG
jgi:hypothetical protein